MATPKGTIAISDSNTASGDVLAIGPDESVWIDLDIWFMGSKFIKFTYAELRAILEPAVEAKREANNATP